jgi:hypothetical protein
MYTLLMKAWNTLPESHQQKVYKNTLATVKRNIKHAENPTPAKVNSLEAAPVDHGIHLDYLTFEVVREEPDIEYTDPNMLIDINCMDDELHFTMPVGCEDYVDEGNEINVSDTLLNATWRRWAAIALE